MANGTCIKVRAIAPGDSLLAGSFGDDKVQVGVQAPINSSGQLDASRIITSSDDIAAKKSGTSDGWDDWSGDEPPQAVRHAWVVQAVRHAWVVQAVRHA